MRRLFPLWLALSCLAAAQAPSPTVSVSGVVKDAATGQPLPDFAVTTYLNAAWSGDTIRTSASTRRVSATTDQQGRYRLNGLTPGAYRIDSRSKDRFGPNVTKNITVGSQDLSDIDFSILVDGVISGTILDENKEPVPGITVMLVFREYFLGSPGHFLRTAVRSDDRGKYVIPMVKADAPYLIVAEKREWQIPAHSQVPMNPKLRRRVPMRTWYPNSPAKEGASPITLRSGEHREGVDIQMRKSQAYCLEGTLTASTGQVPLNFSLEPQQPSSGTYNNGGFYLVAPSGKTGPDGKIRICDLTPGPYRLTAIQSRTDTAQPPAYGSLDVLISDRDLRDVKVFVSPGIALPAEVIWDGPAPEKPLSSRLSLFLAPLLRSNYSGEDASGRSEVPGSFVLPAVLIDDYAIRANVTGPGLYIKDITYDGRSVLYAPLRVGSAMSGQGLRVLVARDGATVNARVQDKDGKLVADASVILLPAEAASEAELSGRMASGTTDQSGQYTSVTLPPGKYLAAATNEYFDKSVEKLGRLWRARSRFKEVEVGPSSSPQLTLELLKIE